MGRRGGANGYPPTRVFCPAGGQKNSIMNADCPPGGKTSPPRGQLTTRVIRPPTRVFQIPTWVFIPKGVLAQGGFSIPNAGFRLSNAGLRKKTSVGINAGFLFRRGLCAFQAIENPP